jgi:hypothetical protein
VQRALPSVGERPHRGLIREVQPADPNLAADVLGHPVAGIDIADRKRDLRPGARQGSRGLDPDPRRPACDDGALAGEVDPLDHLGSGRLEAERCGDQRVRHASLLKWKEIPVLVPR